VSKTDEAVQKILWGGGGLGRAVGTARQGETSGKNLDSVQLSGSIVTGETPSRWVHLGLA